MTDKARELLERALKGLENRKDEVADWGAYASEYFQNKWGYEDSIIEFDGLMEEIRAYLAEPEAKPQPFNQAEFDEMVRKGTQAWKDYAPEQDEEPVAWLSPTSGTFSTVETSHHTAPLFLHPAPRKPFVRLSEEEVNEILFLAHTPYEAICATENMLVRKNTINKSNPDSIDLQSKCRGDKL